MELLFVVIIGALLGITVRYALPLRHTQGALLTPAIGVVSAAVLWEILTWAGLRWDGGMIWWITVLGAAAAVVVADVLLGRRRSKADADRLERLTKTGLTA